MLSVAFRLIMGKIATIGFFDGVHKGHCYLFEHLQQLASQRGLQPLIVTFDAHPRAVLRSDYRPRLLTTMEERRALLSAYGEVLVLPFAEVQPLTAAEFIRRMRDEWDVEALVMGYDHLFGSDRLRHPQDYRRIGMQYGMDILTTGEFTEGEWHVSSTEIRLALENGNIALANELLGRPYSLAGSVVHGNGIGRTIGFPTANIEPLDNNKIVPASGVYEVLISPFLPSFQGRAGVRHSQTTNHQSPIIPALCNIGTNPTIGNTERTIEVHIPDFHGDLYGQKFTLSFLRFIREERKFGSLDGLQQQIKDDLSSLSH